MRTQFRSARFGFRSAFGLTLAMTALAGCSLITSLDEGRITSSSSGTSSNGGVGGVMETSSVSGSTVSAGGMGGMGGTGGAACADPTTDCPPTGTKCVDAVCDGTSGQCATQN